MKLPKIPFCMKTLMGIPGLIVLLMPYEAMGEHGWMPWVMRILGADVVWNAIDVIRKAKVDP